MNLFGHGKFNIGSIGAFTSSPLGGTNLDGSSTGIPLDWVIAVNDNGAFFKQQYIVGPLKYVGNTLPAQASILIHEIGHILSPPGFRPDLASHSAGRINDVLVSTNCRTLIENLATVSPSTLTFAPQTLGTTSTGQQVTLTAPFSSSMNISSITVSGVNSADFVTTTTCGTSLAARARCTVSVTFKPLAAGARSAALNIVGSASNNLQAVALSGKGTGN